MADYSGDDSGVLPDSITAIPKTSLADLAPSVSDPFAGMTWPPPTWGGDIPSTPAPYMAPPPGPLNVGPLDTGMGPLDEMRALPHDAMPAMPDATAPPTVAGELGAPQSESAFAPPPAPPVAPPENADRGLHAPLGQDNPALNQQADRARMMQKWAADPLHPQAGLDLTTAERAKLLADMTPEQRVAYESQHDADAQIEMRKRLVAADTMKAQREQQAYDDHVTAIKTAQGARDKVLADMTALAKQPPPNWMGSRSTLQKFAAFASVIAGGLAQGQGFKGGNVGLEMINKAMADDTEKWRENMSNQRAVLGMRMQGAQNQIADANELYHAESVHNLALHETAIQGIQTEMQQYDPNGTAARDMGDKITALRAQQATIAQGLYDHTLKQNLDISKDVREAQQQAEVARHNKAQEGIEYTRLANEKDKGKAENQELDPAYLARISGTEPPADPTALAEWKKKFVPPVKMTEKQYDAWLKRGGEARKEDLSAGEYKFGVMPNGTNPDGTIKWEPMRQPNGEEWIPQGKPEIIAKVKDKKVAVDDLTRYADEVRRLRSGWSNSVKDREEYQRISADWANAKVAFKNYAALGALSESDYDLMDKALGTGDPTKFLDQSAGIDQARKSWVNSLDASMRTAGYKGKKYDPPDLSKPPAPINTPLQKAHDLANSRKITPELLEQNGILVQGGGGALGGDAADQIRIQQLHHIAAAMQAPATAKEAEDLLAQTAKDGPTAAVRQAAETILREAKEPGFGKPGTKAGLEELAKHPPQINPNPYGAP